MGRRNFHRDADGDGYGHPSVTATLCPTAGGGAPSGYADNDTDCWDSSAADAALVHPGADWQTEPFCSWSAMPCRSASTGEWICSSISSCAGIVPSTYGPPEWDYNCSGAVDTPPAGTSCVLCVGTRGPESPDPANCGEDVTYVGGCGGTPPSCYSRSSGTTTMPCR